MKPLLWMKPSREITPPSAVVFRTRFHLAGKRRFRLRFSADEHADLFLNGEPLTEGPCRGTTARWRDIYEANRVTLSSPSALRPGMVLKLPRP